MSGTDIPTFSHLSFSKGNGKSNVGRQRHRPPPLGCKRSFSVLCHLAKMQVRQFIIQRFFALPIQASTAFLARFSGGFPLACAAWFSLAVGGGLVRIFWAYQKGISSMCSQGISGQNFPSISTVFAPL